MSDTEQSLNFTKDEFGNLFADVRKFNNMYGLPTPNMPTFIPGRLEEFKSILQEEFSETEAMHPQPSVAHLAELADWLGDIVIYCLSEMLRYGLRPEVVLQIIMHSNFSKLGADGLPIYDARNKVMKGPNYWKPEPKLEAYIREARGE